MARISHHIGVAWRGVDLWAAIKLFHGETQLSRVVYIKSI